MEQNVQVVGKKLWHIVRVAFFIVRKNMSKRKLLLDLKYLVMKRPKLTGKSLVKKLTHHNHNHNHQRHSGAYEFSCSNTPNHPFQFNHNKKAHKNKDYTKFSIYEEVEGCEIQAVNKVIEMMTNSNCQIDDVEGSPFPYFYSPVLAGFGTSGSPIVRVTDSPYLLHDVEPGNYKVDEAADEFIQRFYNNLKQQRIMDA
ncbi:uncharacterized protein LOC110715457 [Chenopodium quinoa]|uniref:uncharacterized protein LOC110715457 n=1 Tax=Chenopodium quinoa TaxID=63459 RepID=UPI000B79A2A8|nr:uncharacterized protein LOC110715457 [Chenopodium quinoa]